MNVDTQFTQTPVAAAPERPVPAAPEQISTRPAERPGQDEPSGNQAEQTGTIRNTSAAPQAATGSQSDQMIANEPGNLLDVIV